MRHFCTYFDRNYLMRGLTLYRSLKRHSEPFTLWVLCFDDFTHHVLTRLNLPDLRPVALSEMEAGDHALLQAKGNRNAVEYLFTCSPSWIRYLLHTYSEIEMLTYLDADLFFYSSLDPIYAELGGNSILIVEHRFPSHRRYLELHGIYNVSLMCFRNDLTARECVNWWRERCLEWCHDYPDEGRYADQKYLDDWPQRFSSVVVLQHKGAGLAPWNWMNYRLQFRRRRRGKQSALTVDGQPLIFFHFHSLKIFNGWLYDPVCEGRVYDEMPLLLRWHLYPGYMRALKKTARWVRGVVPEAGINPVYARPHSYGWKKLARKIAEGRLMISPGLK